jgi:hypothetical protein
MSVLNNFLIFLIETVDEVHVVQPLPFKGTKITKNKSYLAIPLIGQIKNKN